MMTLDPMGRTVTAAFEKTRCVQTRPLYQYNYGQLLRIDGLSLPEAYTVDFAVRGGGDSVPALGNADGVLIPDALLDSSGTILAYIFLHEEESDGETEYVIAIPVLPRAARTGEEPDPEQQSVIDQTIAALNTAVEKANAAIAHYPCVVDGSWRVWDVQSGEYVDTGVSATGPKGDPGSPGTPGERGPQGEPGPKGEPGDDYVLTEQDKQDVADIVVGDINVPSKVSELENDAGYISTETDPTVPAWAKATSKPAYTAQEVGALPDDTPIPTKVSDLTDDSGHYTKPAGGIPASDLAADVIPTVPVQDVQVNGTSVLVDGVANIPKANASDLGVCKPGSSLSISSSGTLEVRAVGAGEVKAGTSYTRLLTPERQHASAFYGLAKAAGADMAQSSNEIGTYTDDAKSAIRSMLGAIGNTDYATNGAAGVVKVMADYGLYMSNGMLRTSSPTDDQIKAGSNGYRAIKPDSQHKAAFYGLAKAAGDTSQASSSNAIGTYTDTAKDKIQEMLGITDMIAPHEGAQAAHAYSTGGVFCFGGKLYKATRAISVGETITPGTNCSQTTLAQLIAGA